MESDWAFTGLQAIHAQAVTSMIMAPGVHRRCRHACRVILNY